MKHNSEIIAKASAVNVRISPRKMRLVLGLVRGLSAEQALTQLRFSHKAGAQQLAKVIDSAVANAKQTTQVDTKDLVISELTCDMGTTMKRTKPRARGSAFIIRRKSSHVNVALSLARGVTAKKKKADSNPKNKVVEVASTDLAESKKTETAETVKQKTVKTSEQVKANRVTQKRRLFNRKGGEA